MKMVHHHFCVGAHSALREMEGINSNRFRGCQHIDKCQWFEVADKIIRHKFIIGRDLNSILRDGSRTHTHTTSTASLLRRNPERELNPFQGKGHKPLQTNGRCQRFYGGELLNQPS